MRKMLGRLGWRGQCSCCNGPKDKKAVRAEEKQAWERAEIADWLAEDEMLVCTYHKRFLPCRRCQDDPHEEDWSNRKEDVDDVAAYQRGEAGD